jgi:hypothetical protein
MNTRILQSLIALALIASVHQAAAQSTTFTYQGRLTDGTNAANGSYDLTFSLFSVSSGPGQVGSIYITSATPVSNGLFTVTLDFGANFPGANRWLEISVRTNGGGAYTTLSPRQAITATPYAVFATTSGTASNLVNGSVVKSLNGLRDDVTLAAGTNMTITPNGNTLTLAAVGAGGSGIWSVLNNNAYYNAGNVGIGTTTPSTYGHGGTARILEVNNSGTTLNSQAHLMLYSGVSSLADSAMGTVTWAQPGGMAAYIGAQTRSTTPNMPSAMLTFGTRKSGEASATPKMFITEDGNVGIGTSTPANRLDVAGNVGITGMESFGASTRQMITLYDSGVNSTFGIGVQDGAFYQRCGTGSGFAWFYGGVHNNGQYNPGTGGATLMTLTGTGRLGIGSTTPQAQLEVVGQDALRLVGYQPFLTLLDDNAGYARGRIQGANGDIFLDPESVVSGSDPNAYVKVASSGNVSVKTLTIRGGADVAEPFPMSTKEILKGSVVVIDDENAGQLKLSDRAYDSRVAGIVSGANGINPGIALHQDGALEGGQNVALSGRVYVLADASSGAIKPGDLLTTSSTPGRAMKVSDHVRAQGAILGKAMTALSEGQGMVLVLVTLQ